MPVREETDLEQGYIKKKVYKRREGRALGTERL